MLLRNSVLAQENPRAFANSLSQLKSPFNDKRNTRVLEWDGSGKLQDTGRINFAFETDFTVIIWRQAGLAEHKPSRLHGAKLSERRPEQSEFS